MHWILFIGWNTTKHSQISDSSNIFISQYKLITWILVHISLPLLHFVKVNPSAGFYLNLRSDQIELLSRTTSNLLTFDPLIWTFWSQWIARIQISTFFFFFYLKRRWISSKQQIVTEVPHAQSRYLS